MTKQNKCTHTILDLCLENLGEALNWIEIELMESVEKIKEG